MDSRRNFIKKLGILGAGYVLVPKIIRANSLENTTIYVPDVDGTEYTGSIVKVFDAGTGFILGSAITEKSIANISITSVREGKDNSDLLDNISAKGSNGELNIKYPVHDNSEVKISLCNSIGQQLSTEEHNLYRGNYEFYKNINNLASGVYIVRIQTKDYISDTKLVNVEGKVTGATTTNINIKSKNKISSLSKLDTDEYKIEVINPEKHYKRTFFSPKTNYIEDRVVGYVKQENVTPKLFKDFCEEANFSMGSNGMGYTGLKTYMPKENKKIVIRNMGRPSDPCEVTIADQQYIKNLIEKELYPHIKESNRPPIEIVTLNNYDPLPEVDGQTTIFPYPAGFYITTFDDNSDGIMDRSNIKFSATEWQDPKRTGSELQEILSAFCGPNQVDGGSPGRFEYMTVLSSGTAALLLTAMDKKLIKISEYYKPKEEIESILGL